MTPTAIVRTGNVRCGVQTGTNGNPFPASPGSGRPLTGKGLKSYVSASHRNSTCTSTANTKAGIAQVRYEPVRKTTSRADPGALAEIVPTNKLKTVTTTIASPASRPVRPSADHTGGQTLSC